MVQESLRNVLHSRPKATLIQPTFVAHLPKELVPLAKLSPDDPTTVEVFELCINGQEIAPGYTEQNNPIEQRERYYEAHDLILKAWQAGRQAALG